MGGTKKKMQWLAEPIGTYKGPDTGFIRRVIEVYTRIDEKGPWIVLKDEMSDTLMEVPVDDELREALREEVL